MNESILDQVKGGLIVSCQALEHEPLYSSHIMARMAYAAKLGGAVGIRANTVVDINEIKKVVNLPIIGIIKQQYGECNVYNTPTLKEVDQLVDCGVEIIAIDATKRTRPDGKTLDECFKEVRMKYPDQLFMADCSTYEEGIHAAEIGFDFIGTTMHGYTDYTQGATLPNFDLIGDLVRDCGKPVIAEGGIWSPEDLKKAIETGALTAVVGTAITRPMDITKRYVEALK
ncbi:MAG: N-acetylmannosamine-6-phosphate 2-epimerase [Niameybacter sp.]